jgi:outer membrane murein-binding lipoprotein Lpp
MDLQRNPPAKRGSLTFWQSSPPRERGRLHKMPVLCYCEPMKKFIYNIVIQAVREVINQDVYKRIDELEQKMNARFDAFEQKMNARIDGLEQKMNALEQRTNARFDELEQRTNARFDAFEQKMNALEQRTNARFDAFEQKMNARFDAFEARIDSISADLANIKGNLEGEARAFHIAGYLRNQSGFGSEIR